MQNETGGSHSIPCECPTCAASQIKGGEVQRTPARSSLLAAVVKSLETQVLSFDRIGNRNKPISRGPSTLDASQEAQVSQPVISLMPNAFRWALTLQEPMSSRAMGTPDDLSARTCLSPDTVCASGTSSRTEGRWLWMLEALTLETSRYL